MLTIYIILKSLRIDNCLFTSAFRILLDCNLINNNHKYTKGVSSVHWYVAYFQYNQTQLVVYNTYVNTDILCTGLFQFKSLCVRVSQGITECIAYM